MICPKCGYIDKSVPVTGTIKTAILLGICAKCKSKIYRVPTQKRGESSQFETVLNGEAREEHLVKIYLKTQPGHTSQKRSGASDIDRDILDEKGNVIYYWEIKERSNSLNAYGDTQFPYAKIEEGKRLTLETGKPTYIVLKFVDCWARILVDPKKEFRKGDAPFAPRYRPWQNNSPRQVPVQIPVEDLEILNMRAECQDSF